MVFFLHACGNAPASDPPPPVSVQVADTLPAIPVFFPFDRNDILDQLAQKSAQSIPLVVHVFVPLCDNENQGIIPVNASLGNGFNLQTNLYWGARYGVRAHFKNLTDWKLLDSRLDPTPDLLERVVFQKTYSPNRSVVLIADAYRGDRMRICVSDFFNTLAGVRQDSAYLQYGIPDLVAFNGHNGLMDNFELDFVTHSDSLHKDAVVIACASHAYFKERLNYAGGYPLVATTNLMAPEAYVLEAVIDSWARSKTEDEILDAAGSAYHRYQQCGERGARRLFTGGW